MSDPPSETNCTNGSEAQCGEVLARLEHELELVTQALALLGLRRCFQCGKFSRAADRGALFDGREPVCIACLDRWWKQMRARLSVKEREIVERRLVTWLVSYHGARVTVHAAPADEAPHDSLCLVAGCSQCDGSGRAGGRPCGGCEGRGTVWVVVPRASETKKSEAVIDVEK